MPLDEVVALEVSKYAACSVVEEPVVDVFPKKIRLCLSSHAAEFIQLSHLEF